MDDAIAASPGGEMDVIEAIYGRRSIRAYGSEALGPEVIEALIADAAQAPPPTPRYARPWQFHVVTGAERLAEMGERAIAFARDHALPETRGPWLEDPRFQVFWGAPALILITCPAGDINAAWDCCRAAQTLMLSAHARGLGACWVGSAGPWLKGEEGRQALAIPADYDPIAPIILGHPTGPPPAAPARTPPPVVWC